jgi:hypothetical protein
MFSAVEDTAYGCFEIPIDIQFNNVQKIFTINYDLTLSMGNHISANSNSKKSLLDKKAHVEFEQIVEIKDPPSREFVNLALKYGGRVKGGSATPKVIPDESKKSAEPRKEKEKEKHSKKHKHKERKKSKEHKRSKHSDERSSSSKREHKESAHISIGALFGDSIDESIPSMSENKVKVTTHIIC